MEKPENACRPYIIKLNALQCSYNDLVYMLRLLLAVNVQDVQEGIAYVATLTSFT